MAARRPWLRRRRGRGAAPRRTRGERDEADRSARAYHSDGYERGRSFDGAQHDDVVGGALLAENAGAPRGDRAGVEPDRKLVQNISGSARQQTGAAQNIARNMQVLKEISAQTAESTNATSAAIAKLAELSAGLRKAAAGFRLPAPRRSRSDRPEPSSGLKKAARRRRRGRSGRSPRSAAPDLIPESLSCRKSLPRRLISSVAS